MQLYLETPRLRLRRFTPADEEVLVELDGDPEVMRYISGGAPTPRRFIETDVLPRFLRSYEGRDGFGVWAAIERRAGDFVGWFSLLPSDGGNPTEARLGFRLRKAAWGKGYATEGARALVRKSFEELGVTRLLASTYQDNVASQRVMEKAGMVPRRRFRPTASDLLSLSSPDRLAGEIWEGDEVEYALEKSTWERAHPR